MTPAEAEAIVALALELDQAALLGADEDAFRSDRFRQLAAERVVERIYQAAVALDPSRAEHYFGGDGLRHLRGMRNRLAHNYLAVDNEFLWEAVSADVVSVRGRLDDDLIQAAALLGEHRATIPDEADDWRSTHLGPT